MGEMGTTVESQIIDKLREDVSKLERALRYIAGAGDYTRLCPDESLSSGEQNCYSWGITDAYRERAEFAKAALSSVFGEPQ